MSQKIQSVKPAAIGCVLARAKTLWALVMLAVVLYGVAPGLAHAEKSLLTVPTDNDDKAQWSLVADTVRTLGENTIIEAEGGVVLERGKDVLKADFARLYTDTNWIFLKGNVFVRMGRDDISADRAEFDLRSKTGWLTNGNVFVEGPHMYLSGETMVKHWGDRYTFEQAKITTCDGESPPWALQASEVVVEIDGYAQLFHSNLLVKDQTVMYSPFMVLPAKTTRQSGFLPPDYGYSNKRGIYYTQPYFWAMDESRDMTFYGGFMSELGPLVGVQYRAHPYSTDKTMMTFSGMYDRNAISAPGDDDVYNAGYLRTNHDRFWLRGMSDGHLGTSGWRYRSNIDFVSDQNYLREFNGGPLGFNRSRNELFNMFGRDIQEEGLNRVSQAMVYKDWERFGVVGSLRYEQNAFLGHGNASRSTDTIVQQLPRMDGFLYKGRVLPQFPLEAEAQFTSGYMYRQSGTSGLRSEIYPRLSLPLDFGAVSLITSGGLRQTFYTNERTSDSIPTSSLDGLRQGRTTRTVPDVGVQAYTQLSRIWNFAPDESLAVREPVVGTTELAALRHEVQPRIRYSYVPTVDQERNPFYVADDRVLSNNELVYSITNIITRKQARVVPAPPATGDSAANAATAAAPPETPVPLQVTYDYLDIVRWRIESGYDFNEARRVNYLDEHGRRPFLDILSDFELYFTSWFGYQSKLYVTPDGGELTRYDHTVSFSVPNWGSWVTGISVRDKYYDYRRRFRYQDMRNVRLAEPVRLLQNHLNLTLTPNWSVHVSDYRNIRQGGGTFGRSYDQDIDIVYSAQCYRFIGRYSYDGYDKSYSFMVEIPGLFE